MPELPEVEITARRLGATLAGSEIESATAPGMVALKTVKPPLDALVGRSIEGMRRIGKMLLVDIAAANGEAEGDTGPLTLLVHLMSAGRLQVYDKRASMKDRRSRILIRIADGRELRLREFGSKQRAWGRLLPREAVAEEEMVATLGPEAWPAPPRDEFAEAISLSRHLHPMLRDQRVVAGVGRSWVDELLWEARLSPFKKGSDLDTDEVDRLHASLHVLGEAIEFYESEVGDTIPDKLPMPLQVHRRQAEPCPRCGTTLEAVFFAEHLTTYCPKEQTGGRVLKDRRLSRLLK
ncbi:MAG: DNA-formamidopyrimidine glycosylase family protein [Solirubrobacterales bacterium]